MPFIELRTVNLDCADPQAMARFYGGLLGWEPTAVEPDWVLMRNPQGGTGLSFQQTEDYQRPVWPEQADRQQKMIHLDLRVIPPGAPDGFSAAEGQAALDAALKLAESLGGVLAEPQNRDDVRVVLDPAGHPLCLFLD
ncbi:MAG TPA: VOC family protein [Candidatus Limnocylindrales bacterium]|nr:VOC family protein [Candidatus Limnocylindrales bacterium]